MRQQAGELSENIQESEHGWSSLEGSLITFYRLGGDEGRSA